MSQSMSQLGKLYSGCAGYLTEPVFSFEETIDTIIQNLSHTDMVPEFDTIVGSGLSGALVIPAVATFMDKRWAIVRKDNETSHSFNNVEGSIGYRWIILDDLVDTRETMNHIIDTVQKTVKSIHGDTNRLTYIGRYMYWTHSFVSSDIERKFNDLPD